MILFDTHFHYYGEDEPLTFRRKIDETMRATPGAPVPERLLLLAAGGNYLDSCRARDFAALVQDSFFSAGVHPHEAEKELHGVADFAPLLASPRCVAVGELGLDFFYDHAPRRRQCEVLESFLDLALQTGKPAILHCRDLDGRFEAYDEMLALIRPFAERGGRMVVHCFAGTPAWAEKFLALGAYLGVTGIVTFKAAENIRATLKVIPADRLLLETDAPYLAPVPHRGKTNTPGYLPLVAERVALELGLSVAEVAATTTANGLKLFGIGALS